MDKPEELCVDPHPWQLKGAAQLHHLCINSPFAGGLCGDERGLGKTILAILVMWLAKDEPGSFSLVVCPKGVTDQWVEEIDRVFKEVGQHLLIMSHDPNARIGRTTTECLCSRSPVNDRARVTSAQTRHRHMFVRVLPKPVSTHGRVSRKGCGISSWCHKGDTNQKVLGPAF